MIRVGGKQVAEHRHIMEKHLGTPLPEGSVIHHINGVKTDNRIENLELIDSQGTHVLIHCKNFRSETEKQCSACGIIKPRSDFYTRKGRRDPHYPQCKQCKRK